MIQPQQPTNCQQLNLTSRKRKKKKVDAADISSCIWNSSYNIINIFFVRSMNQNAHSFSSTSPLNSKFFHSSLFQVNIDYCADSKSSTKSSSYLGGFEVFFSLCEGKGESLTDFFVCTSSEGHFLRITLHWCC